MIKMEHFQDQKTTEEVVTSLHTLYNYKRKLERGQQESFTIRSQGEQPSVANISLK